MQNISAIISKIFGQNKVGEIKYARSGIIYKKASICYDTVEIQRDGADM